jgi:protein-S-isoprenylcysteine O-methyltransferase Ste14
METGDLQLGKGGTMEKNSPVQESRTPDTSRGVIRWAVRETMGLVMMGVILFLAAGTWRWVWGWALVILMTAWVAATAAVVVPRYPQLLAERTGPRKGAKAWDTALMGGVGMVTLAAYVVAGVDVRNGWSPDMPSFLHSAALAVAAAGYAITVWATASNPFFSQIVRIQTERGHTVASGGPYRFIRHPSYLGQIAVFLAMPIVLGSWWAGLGGLAGAFLILLRTALEDRTLQAELPGFSEYAAKVRYRLIPQLW